VGDGPLVLARLAGNEPLVAAQRRELATLGDVAAVDGDVWARLRAIEPPGATVVRVSTLPVALPALLGDALAPQALASRTFLHATLSRGVIRCILPPETLGVLTALIARTRAHFAAPRTWIWEKLPPERWGELAPSPTDDRLSRRTRDAFDPMHILNRGIFGEGAA
ncbi:MAG: hypothetical protein HOQ09_04835, partial [Gemmatimonadaceae bacterium]|nr:hypothetical protein [Gemmatimonadaceae bacterium]